jgi:hypothetical protein
MEKLDELGEYGPWKELSGVKDDKRMRGAELILRFLALAFKLDEYEKPLANFLNKFAQSHRNGADYLTFERSFKSAVDSIFTELIENIIPA